MPLQLGVEARGDGFQELGRRLVVVVLAVGHLAVAGHLVLDRRLPARARRTVARVRFLRLYMNGKGVDEDHHEALRWLKRVAAKPSQFQEKAKEGVKYLTTGEIPEEYYR